MRLKWIRGEPGRCEGPDDEKALLLLHGRRLRSRTTLQTMQVSILGHLRDRGANWRDGSREKGVGLSYGFEALQRRSRTNLHSMKGKRFRKRKLAYFLVRKCNLQKKGHDYYETHMRLFESTNIDLHNGLACFCRWFHLRSDRTDKESRCNRNLQNFVFLSHGRLKVVYRVWQQLVENNLQVPPRNREHHANTNRFRLISVNVGKTIINQTFIDLQSHCTEVCYCWHFESENRILLTEYTS